MSILFGPKTTQDSEVSKDATLQARIITFFNSKYKHLYDPQVVWEKDKQEVLKKLASGEIGKSECQELLLQVIPNFGLNQLDHNSYNSLNRQKADLNDKQKQVLLDLKTKAEKRNSDLFKSVGQNKQARYIISVFLTGSSDNRDFLTDIDFNNFLENYPEPSIIMERMPQYLDFIEKSNGIGKRREYETSLKSLMSSVYGKRFEYFQQIELLKREAQEKYPQTVVETQKDTNTYNQTHNSDFVRSSKVDMALYRTKLNNAYTNIIKVLVRVGKKFNYSLIDSPEFRKLESENSDVITSQNEMISKYQHPQDFTDIKDFAIRNLLVERYRESNPPRSGAFQKDRGEFQKTKLLEGSPEECESVMFRAKIVGEPFLEKSLTTDILKNEGLEPKYKVSVGDTTYWFGKSMYSIGQGRVALTAYVEKDGKVNTVTYYRSNSQSVWRYLPDYTFGGPGEIGHYGKGYGEESVTLPIALQKVIHQMPQFGIRTVETKTDTKLIFAGTAALIRNRNFDYYQQTSQNPDVLSPDLSSKLPPEKVELTDPERQSPDFSRVLDTWVHETSTYGKVTNEVFLSKDGNLRFLFCRDTHGRSWIAQIENNSEIGSAGVRKSWVSGGALTTPVYEYVSQSAGYQGQISSDGAYRDISQSFHNKIPLIHEYLKS